MSVTPTQRVLLESVKKYVDSMFFDYSSYCILDAGRVFYMFNKSSGVAQIPDK